MARNLSRRKKARGDILAGQFLPTARAATPASLMSLRLHFLTRPSLPPRRPANIYRCVFTVQTSLVRRDLLRGVGNARVNAPFLSPPARFLATIGRISRSRGRDYRAKIEWAIFHSSGFYSAVEITRA